MIKLDKAIAMKQMADVALLPETKIRIEAFLYEKLYDLAEEIPSLTQEHWRTSYSNNDPVIDLAEKIYDSEISDTGAIILRMDLRADFDDIVAMCTAVTPNQITYLIKHHWKRHGVSVAIKLNITAKMDDEYLQVLKNLGMIHREPGYAHPSYETVFCGSRSNNDLPF